MECAKWIGSLVVAWLLAGSGLVVAQTRGGLPLSVDLETCATSALPAERVASFVGAMPAMSGATRMQMRFDLQRRRPDERMWHRVYGVQGFGVWETALPARSGFVFHKRVDGLQVPASYRSIVRFRWLRSDGTIVRSVRRRTPACVQPDLRPDIVQGRLRAVLDARPALAVYTLAVRNAGRSTAGAFTVRIADASTEVPRLAAGAQVEVTLVARMCLPGPGVRVVVDADRRVDESDERNAIRRRCPLG